jgi:hypothetical protein
MIDNTNYIVSAEIDRADLVSALHFAEAAFKEQCDILESQMKSELAAIMAQERSINLYLFKIRLNPLTKEQAEEKLGGMFGWRWKAYRDREWWHNRLVRVQKLRDTLNHNTLHNIRLPESDLCMLQDFL